MHSPTAPSCSSSGAATGWSSAAIDALAGSETPLAILPAGTANLLATNLGHPAGHRAGGRDRPRRGAAQARRRPVQRRALRRHGRRRLRRGDDRAGRRRRSRIASDASPTSGPARRTSARSRSRRRSRSTAPPGTPALRAASSSATSAASSAASRCSRTRARTTAGSSSASSTPTASPTGCERWRARPSGMPERSPLVQATTAKKIKVKLNRKVLYEVDGGDREKVRSFTVKVQPAAITICLPERGVGARCQRFSLIPRRSLRTARSSEARGSSSTRAFEILSRAGFVARALDLRDHRPARLRPRDRARRQDHEPAGRAADGRAAALRSRPARAPRDRPRRLRDLAPVPGRPRPRSRGSRQRHRAPRRARQRDRLRG